MTSTLRQRINNLELAMVDITNAKALIEKALGDSDVNQWYSTDLMEMLAEIKQDIDALLAEEAPSNSPT